MPQTKTTKTKLFDGDPEWEAWAKSLPVAYYPPEVVERWNKEIEIMDAQIATGELKPKTAAEMAAERGITLD